MIIWYSIQIKPCTAQKKIALLCQRGFGLGADGVLYGPVEINGKMGVHIYNSDGSEAAISGNGVRILRNI